MASQHHVYAIPQKRRNLAITLEEEALLKDFIRPGTSEWELFFSSRSLIRRKLGDGKETLVMTRDQGLVDEKLAARADELESDKGFIGWGNRRSFKKKKYELAALITDVDLMEKFGITYTLVNQIKAIAAEDTLAAARDVQEIVRSKEGHEKAVVVPGNYAGSWKASRDAIRVHAARFPLVSVSTPALFIGTELFIYGPGKVWSVYGSERIASLLRLVYAMIMATSPQTIVFALGAELTILGINVQCNNEVLSPVRELHAGPHDDLPKESSASIMSAMSSQDRMVLQELSEAVHLVEVDGVAAASAVRVSESHVLMCEHVTSLEGTITLDGVPCSPLHALSRDMWLVESKGNSMPWHVRQPRENERVLLCYRRFNKICLLGPMRITSYDKISLTYSKHKDLAPGMSGAAVVAMSDFSLLGIHDGTSSVHGIGSTFSQAMYTDMWTSHVSSYSMQPPTVSVEMAAFEIFEEKGMAMVMDQVYDCIEPVLEGGTHCGSALIIAPHVMVPGLLDQFVARQPGHVQLDRQVKSGLAIFKNTAVASFKRPPVVRDPVFGEKLHFLCKDADGDLCSKGNLTVIKLKPRERTFEVKGSSSEHSVNFLGATIVSDLECAVVGQIISVITDPESKTNRIVAAMIPEFVNCSQEAELSCNSLTLALPGLDMSRWPKPIQDDTLEIFLGNESLDRLDHYRRVGHNHLETRYILGAISGGMKPEDVADSVKIFFSDSAYDARSKSNRLTEYTAFVSSVYSNQSISMDTGQFFRIFTETLVGMTMLYERSNIVDETVAFIFYDMS